LQRFARKKRVRVNAVAPGGVETPMSHEIDFPEEVNWELAVLSIDGGVAAI